MNSFLHRDPARDHNLARASTTSQVCVAGDRCRPGTTATDAATQVEFMIRSLPFAVLTHALNLTCLFGPAQGMFLLTQLEFRSGSVMCTPTPSWMFDATS